MVKVKDLSKHYGAQAVLDDITFQIPRGSVAAIIGRSGAGKSVLLRQLTGLENPDSGTVLIDGEDICAMDSRELNRVRKSLGILFQEGALFDSLTVEENVAFPLKEHTRLSEGEISRIAVSKLDEVGMGEHSAKYPEQISGGMRKRAALARALVMDPDVVFFDEPTSGLDPITKGSIYRLISETHRERPITYVLVSHDIGGILRMADKVMFLHDGKIRSEGTPQEIEASPDPVVQQFLAGSPEGPVILDGERH